MIKSNLSIPPYFFQPEERCGFLVTKERKELWAVEMDLLQQVIRVCEKYGFHYYALGGTLLGAVRHGGFIPWDDDIDILMPRKDYDRLLEIADQEFQMPYFLSSPMSEYCFWRKHAQLRNSDTTGTIINDVYENNNKGIFIDIFPMDYVPDTLAERNEQRQRIYKITHDVTAKSALLHVNAKKKSFINLIKYLFFSIKVGGDSTYKATFSALNNELRSYADKDTRTLGHASLTYKERGIWPEEWYADSVALDFEFMKIQAPVNYDEVLRCYFGDNYMDIPNEYPSSTHGGLIVDVDTPFQKNYPWKRR